MPTPVDVGVALAQFDGTSLEHLHRRRALKALRAFYRSPARIGFLTGPEQSGKSDVARVFAERTNRKAGREAMPVLVARATGLCGTVFQPDQLVREFALAAKVPALEHLCAPPQQVENLFGQTHIVPRLPKGSQRERTEVMCAALRNAVAYRQVDLLVVDQIERIFSEDRPRHLVRYRYVEEIAEQTGVRMLLVGRDSLVASVLASVQALGPPPVVRLPRYADLREGSGYEQFRSFAQKLLDDVPGITMEPIDHQAMGRLHAKCLGCPGLLANLVREALSDALPAGLFRSAILRVDDVVRKGQPATYLRARLQAIQEGEEAIRRYVEVQPHDELILQQELGLTPRKQAPRNSTRTPKWAAGGNAIHRRKVGEHTPRRIRPDSA
ncbi:MAG: AAA family ATPase [Rhodospirillales bacterium]|nr:AAA family ATPase [Rhodospirillales bacterium]MDE0711447.1 AAA family ATPase [Rhodospirillales bacterium]